MNKIKFYCSFFLVFNIYFSLYSQEIVIQLLVGTNHTKLLYHWEEELVDDEGLRQDVYNIAIGISAQTGKYLYFKTEIGTNNIDQGADIRYRTKGSLSLDQSLGGTLKIRQNYLDILQEFRWKFLFLNAGLGLITRTGSKLNGIDYFNGTFGSFAVNLGFNRKSQNIGFLASVGYKHITKKARTDWVPGLSLNQLHFQFGMTYHLYQESQ